MSGKPQSYRSRVLRVVNAHHGWLTARDIAARTSLTYLQTLFALNALLNAERIARKGRKSSAMWGSLVLIEHNPSLEALNTLESIFHGFARQRND